MLERLALKATNVGFEAIAAVQKLMSFHDPDSDVGRLNRCACSRAVAVDSRTFHVVRRAIEFAARSDGCFDITVAGELVTRGYLPRPSYSSTPDPTASWRDIELIGENKIKFHRPLWIDLGGIGKGFAVDYAFARMPLHEGAQTCVNAGGDLRIQGPLEESVLLQATVRDFTVPIVILQDGCIASSATHRRMKPDRRASLHVHGVHRHPIACRSFVSVIARECLVADALTKIVLICGQKSEEILRHYDAAAYLSGSSGWVALGRHCTAAYEGR